VSSTEPPLIVITQADPETADDPALMRQKVGLYHAAIERAGGRTVGLDERTPEHERRSAFARMDGLLLSGGADIDPAVYGRANSDATAIQRGRDTLELEAFRIAADRERPVLGICRGLQAINAFSGGVLVQHVDGHRSPDLDRGPAQTHLLRIAAGSRLSAILRTDGTLPVNTFHHQAVRIDGLAPGLVATGFVDHPDGELVEALEAPNGRFLVAVQCHPERVESTPAAFERLFAAFVAAARG
jgi:putative glutamine amidotransferase